MCSLDEFRSLSQRFLTRVPREGMERIKKFDTLRKAPNTSLNMVGIFCPAVGNTGLITVPYHLSRIFFFFTFVRGGSSGYKKLL